MKMRTSLTLADCGNFAVIKTHPDTVKSLLICTVYGFCSAVAERKTPDKLSTYKALQGQFRIKPNGDGEAVEGGLLIFPPNFLAMLSAPIKKLDETPGAELRFAYDLNAVRANNEAGFNISFSVRSEPAVGGKLDDFVNAVDAAKKKK